MKRNIKFYEDKKVNVENFGYFFVEQHPVFLFIFENRKQINQKANKFGCDVSDVFQEVCLIFIEKYSSFNSDRGSLKSFVFGNLEKVLMRQTIGPLRFAISIDDDSEQSKNILAEIEYNLIYDENNFDTENIKYMVPGGDCLKSISDEINGRSVKELASEFGLTPRRIRQVLNEIVRTSNVQFSFKFKND